jgi:hypothetical protein
VIYAGGIIQLMAHGFKGNRIRFVEIKTQSDDMVFPVFGVNDREIRILCINALNCFVAVRRLDPRKNR